MSQTATLPAPQRATLSRELSEFLIEFSIGVHRYAMYPPGHPSLDPIVENIVGRLGELFVDRRSLSIGVASRQLVIEGVATDQRHPVLADLAKRLHDHQLGAMSFDLGVTAGEISGVLATLAEETEREGIPIGLRDADDFPHWEHARVLRLGYEKLEMKGDSPDEGVGVMDRASALWLGLAQAALATEEPMEDAPDAATIARSIEGHSREAAYDQVIVGYLLQIADELKTDNSEESGKIRVRVSKLLKELDDSTLSRLVDFGGDPGQRRKFVMDANQTLAVDSVMKLLRAAASSEGQTISTSMTRMLSKLALHAESGTAQVRSQADTALRENVDRLMEGWDLKDPNPTAYTTVLDAMARSAPVFETIDQSSPLTGAERLLQTAIEVDAYGPTVAKAVSDLIERGGAGEVLRLLERAPAGSQVSITIKKHLTSPKQFRHILGEGQVDTEALRALVEEMGSAAVDPLLDVLADSDSRSVRRRIFDVLPDLGPLVATRAMERLDDPRWFVQRNMLALLHRLPSLPEGFDPQPFLDHADHRVRREALPLAMRPGSPLRDRSLVTALSDGDERMVRMGLLELKDAVPTATLPTLVNRVVANSDRSSEIRTLAVRCLAGSQQPLARSALLGIVDGGKSMFGKPKLASSSPLVLAAVRGLATTFAGRPEVDEVLDLARKSKDPDLRGAARVSVGGT